MKKETWKEVLSGYYEVSSMGRVRRAKAGMGTIAGRVLELGKNRSKYGYLSFGACINRLSKSVRVHQLVAEAFIGPCPPGKEVNHIDGNKQNNKYTNLEYVTHKENMKHALEIGLLPRGEKIGNSKLTEDAVKELRSLHRIGSYSKVELARKFGVSGVSHILDRKSWKHVA